MIDNNEIAQLQEKIQDCIRNITRLAPMVGAARQVKEFSSDQRKNALAARQIIYIQRGESVAASETLARADAVYVEKFRQLEKDYSDACATIAEWEAVFARLDACRSMLAMSRETMKTLEG